MILTIIGLVIVILLIILLAFVFSGPKISSSEKAVLAKVLDSPLPEMVNGMTGIAKNKKVTLNFESIQPDDSPKATILLINGLSHSMLDWPSHFYEALVEEGYHVIRFDNRDVGMSSWIDDWGKGNYYNLEDMAEDAMAVLDQNQIDKAHIVGMSMGGMIAQTIALNHTNRVLSLCSIMSTGHFYDKALHDTPSAFKYGVIKTLLRYTTVKNLANSCLSQLSIQYLLKGKGDYQIDAQKVYERTLYEIKKRKGFNKKSTQQHGVAIAKSGSRYDGLKGLEMPTLVVHGTDDPLVLFEHGQKYASIIPNAKQLFINGMGHDLPKKYNDEIVENIILNIEEVK